MDRAALILNGSAGWDPESAECSARNRLDCEIVPVAAGANIARITADIVSAGAAKVIAAGGDGTLRAVAQSLAGTEAVMGVLPAGTLNHFARDMEIPLDLNAAVEVAIAGVPVCVDVGEVNGHVFLNNSVIGLYPFYRQQRAAAHGSMVAAMFRTLWRYPYLTIKLKVDETELTRRTPFVMIANNEHAMEGFKPWERDRITEGGLWIYILRDRRRWGILRMLARIATGGRLAGEEFEVFRAAAVSIEAGSRRVRVAIDGEVVQLDAPLQYRSRPGALKVLVPAGSKRVQEALCPIPAEAG
jgi:diacylglycerol kinase family enzyme